MAEKNTVAMFVQGDDGERIQVGWASPKNAEGVRTFEYSPGFENTRPRDVSFEDDELTQKVAEEQHEARLGDGSDGEDFEIQVEEADEPVEVTPETPRVDAAPDPEEAAEPVDATLDEPVELNSGGEIVDTSDEDEEAEFQRLLAQEEAEKNKQEQPQTRRELRDNEN